MPTPDELRTHARRLRRAAGCSTLTTDLLNEAADHLEAVRSIATDLVTALADDALRCRNGALYAAESEPGGGRTGQTT